jgi:predicted regulator of Ras-like GTPase activity (Roadblock/LC7/MglB family)
LDPDKIIEYIFRLPGISGVLVSTEDGLVVGAKLPSGPAAESLAAFTPQLHQRVAQYTSEIGLGDAGHLTVAVQDRLLMILKIKNGYLVALGRPGESLPDSQIKSFVASLNRFTTKE